MKKNLLYIFADQWRAQAVGHMEADQVATPNIDAFMNTSVHFSNAISTYPLCSPHRASLLTGKYPYNCGFYSNCKVGLNEVIMLKPQEITISDVLHEEGYQNGYIGKWHLDASDGNFFKNPIAKTIGWDAYTPAGERRHHFDFWYSYGAADVHMNPFYFTDSPERITYENRWSVDVETEVALDYITNRDKTKPFNLVLSWNPPHPPYDQVPNQYYDKYKDIELKFRDNVPEDVRKDSKFCTKMRQYLAAVEGIDEYFGKILQYLKDNNLYDDTLIVLSSDHGDCLGSHRLFDKNNWYEESIRIPLYMGGAGIEKGNSDVVIGSQDHMPTILEYLGVAIPDTVDGISYAKALRGERIENGEHAMICMFPGMPNAVNAYAKRGLQHKCFGWRGIRHKEYTYVVNNGTRPSEPQKRYYYDLKADPYQLHPIELWSEQSKEFDIILQDYLEKTNDPFLLNQ